MRERQLRAVEFQGAQVGINSGSRNPVTGRTNLDDLSTVRSLGTGMTAAPIVPGTGQIMGGMSNAEVQRVGAGATAR